MIASFSSKIDRLKSHGKENDSPAPMSLELREFIAESREKQTLYANCEGSYECREFEISDKNSIKDFLVDTMYYKEQWPGELTQAQSVVVNRVLKMTINCGQRFRSERIRFSVVWVYYFNYESKSTFRAPVFKILSPRSSSAFYVSTEVKVFITWDEYMESALFPPSFVCAPRHGKYSLVAGKDIVDLEFITSRNAVHGLQVERMTSLSAYSQVAILPLLQKTRVTIEKGAEKLYEMSRNIVEKWIKFWNRHGDIVEKIIVFILKVVIDFKSSGMEKAKRTFKSGFYMLFNSYVDSHAAEHLLIKGNYNLPIEKPINPGSGEETSIEPGACVKLLTDFKALIGNPTMRGFKTFCSENIILLFDIIDKLVIVCKRLLPLELCFNQTILCVILAYYVISRIIRFCSRPKMIQESNSLTQSHDMSKAGVKYQGMLTDRPKEPETESNGKQFYDFSGGIANPAITSKSPETFSEKKPVLCAEEGTNSLYLFPDSDASRLPFDIMSLLGTPNFLLIQSKAETLIKVVDSSFKEIGAVYRSGHNAFGCFQGTTPN